MKRNPAIIDTGPLVAFLNKRDMHHQWVIEQMAELRPPLFTCEAVLSEACFLLRQIPQGVLNLMEIFERGLINIPFRLEEEVQTVQKLLVSYQDVPMSLADACLVRMSEQVNASIVFTLDTDFQIYRKNNREVIPTLMPI